MLARALVVAGLAAAVAAVPATAHAQFKLGLSVGATLPSGDLADGVEWGYHVQGSLSAGAPLVPLGLRIDGMFNSFPGKGDGAGDFRVMGVNANAVYKLPGIAARPYIIGGLGFYNSKPTGDGTDGIDATNALGFNVGGGIEFGLAGFATFAEARYHAVPSGYKVSTVLGDAETDVQFIPITFGIRF